VTMTPSLGLASALALLWFCSVLSSAQRCPHGTVDFAELTAQIESTKDPLVIRRAAAIGGQALIPALRKVSRPGMSSETAPGAAQASLAKLGDEVAFVELDAELKGKIGSPVWAINKLLLVNNPQSISMIMAYLDKHRGPITLGCEIDACYDDVPVIYGALADGIVNAPVQRNGKYKGDWLLWWKHETPIPFSISGNLQDPYEQCLARKIEWNFDMALVDLGGTGDQRALPGIKKFGSMGYALNEYLGPRAQYPSYIWLRHDYVETALAELGDAAQFSVILAHLKTNSFQTEIQKLQIIGGKDAVEALVNSSKYFNTAWGGPFLKALSQMVQNPSLPPGAQPSEQNIRTWKEWWAKNKNTARFVRVPAFE
jgi:hypothetical protein